MIPLLALATLNDVIQTGLFLFILSCQRWPLQVWAELLCRGRIFSRVRPFYERAVSNLDL
jgi:hypothetical protein